MINSPIRTVIIWLFLLYIVLCPFYIFPSGTPQPADFILSFDGLLLLFVFNKDTLKYSPVKSLIVLILLITIVNGLNQFDLYISNIAGNTYMSTLFYVFNFMAFILTFYIVEVDTKRVYNLVSKAILLSVAIQCFCSALGLGNTGGRSTVFFNNPNQLGYYALCSFTLFAVIPSVMRKNKLALVSMIVMSGYLMLVSQSRAALVGVGVLTIVILFKEGFKINASSILFLGVFIIGSYFLVNQSQFIENQLGAIKTRNINKSTTFDEEIKIRGYDRMFLYSEFLLYGAGEGGEARFKKAFHQGELHSGLGVILFSYGIMGLFLFLLFLFKILRLDFFSGLILIVPILLYNFAHQGLRESFFWISLALIYLQSIKRYKMKNFDERRHLNHNSNIDSNENLI